MVEMVGDRARRRRVVRPVEPDLAAGGQEVVQRTGGETLQARRPFGPAEGSAKSWFGQSEAILVAQHRHGEGGIQRLVAAGEAGQGQAQFAPLVAIVKM